MSNPILETRGLTKVYNMEQENEFEALRGIDFKAEEGEFITILGSSGCGKTTLLRMVAGFNSIEGGSFRFNDKEINSMEPGKRGIGMVFQNYAVFPHMSVLP